MKTKKIESAKLITYIVDCKPNDSVDIKCGGPPTLGFDFFVDAEKNVTEVKNFIKSMLEKYDKPLMRISTGGTGYRPVGHAWSYDRIEKCIRDTNF